MTHPTIVEQIKKYFRYLFDESGFTVVSETYFDSFGNWVVVLASDDCRLRFFQDRGEVSIAVSPLWSPPGWQAGPWFDLPIVTAYLTQGQYTWEYAPGSTEQQLERLAGILRPYCDQICAMFRKEVFPEKEEELRGLETQRSKRLWDKLHRARPH